MENKYHYFFAVKLPNEAKDYLKNWVATNQLNFPFKRWVHYEDYHITLAFLGFAEQDQLKKAIAQVEEITTAFKPFFLSLNEIGIFGKSTSPRIFWADVVPSKQLSAIQEKVYNQCKAVGFDLDKKPFRPHITLARKWDSERPFELEKLTKLQSEDETRTFQVEEIVLYETHLNQTPKYKEFHHFKLK